MSDNLGKKFEQKFKEDFAQSFPNGTIDRLYDVTLGYKTISQVCDFIGYDYPNIMYLECKTIKGNTFPLSNLTQYDKLIEKKDVKGAIVGAVIWFYEHDKVVFVPIKTFEKLKDDDKKSVNIKYLENKLYNIIEIPSIKKRIFMDSDYAILKEEH